jgi:hypothetical protein
MKLPSFVNRTFRQTEISAFLDGVVTNKASVKMLCQHKFASRYIVLKHNMFIPSVGLFENLSRFSAVSCNIVCRRVTKNCSLMSHNSRLVKLDTCSVMRHGTQVKEYDVG